MIEDRQIDGGVRVIATHGGQTIMGTTYRTKTGLGVRLDDGWQYPSLTKAAEAITGTTRNGWEFFSLASDEDRAANPEPPAQDTVRDCGKGHTGGPEMFRQSGGREVCRQCERERHRQARAARRAQAGR